MELDKEMMLEDIWLMVRSLIKAPPIFYDEEMLEDIWLMVRSLVKTPPIFYDEDEQQYFCKCCFNSIERTPATIQDSDVQTFDHTKVCPVARARRIEAKLRSSHTV